MSDSRYILGIDPGLRSTGFGLIEQSGNTLAYVASGCIKTDANGTLPERLLTIAQDIQSIINQHKPDDVVVEKVFVNVNPQSTLLLGQARGAAITAAVLAGATVYEYTALQVKQAVVGRKSRCKKWSNACSNWPSIRKPTPPMHWPPPSPMLIRDKALAHSA